MVPLYTLIDVGSDILREVSDLFSTGGFTTEGVSLMMTMISSASLSCKRGTYMRGAHGEGTYKEHIEDKQEGERTVHGQNMSP